MTMMKNGALLLVLLVCNHALARFRVTDLRLEHMVNPSVVDVANPRFSWVNECDSRLRGQRQTAYRIVVASSEQNLRRGRYDVWDSGKTSSGESSLVPYSGTALHEDTDYWWKVMTWDGQGKPSAWSPESHWTQGINDAHWTALWIGAGQETGGAPLLRQSFAIKKKVRRARVYISGLGFSELYVNGKRVGDDYLSPNLMNYSPRHDLDSYAIRIEDNFRDARVPYLSYDLAPLLQQGDNEACVILGNGFFNPDRLIAACSKFGEPCLRYQLSVTYADGEKEMFVSDGSWQTRPSPIAYNGVFRGEIYDAGREVDTTTTPWTRVALAEGPRGKMCAQTSPTDRITQVLTPISLTKVSEKTWEVDFGVEIAGWIRFHGIHGAKGDTVRVDFVCESPQGTQQYVLKGAKQEDYAPRFTWFVFSKARITGLTELTPDMLTAEAVNTDVAVDSEFESSNPLLDQIRTIWLRSQTDNMHGCIASDCPHRERLPYTGDGQAAAEMVMLNFDAAAFYQKWIRDMRDSQNRGTGYVPNGAPWQPNCGGGVAWGAAMNIMPWQFYVQYGDRRMLEDSFFAMQEQVRCMLSWLTPDGTMHQQMKNHGTDDMCYWLCLGDWCPPGALPNDELVHTFYLWLCLDYTARAAQALSKGHEAARYRLLAESVKRAFHQKFYDAAHHTYGDGGSNIFALRMGVPADRHDHVVATLRHEIMTQNNGHINTGFLAGKYFFETLSDVGLTDVAYTALTRRDYPSFGHWIEQGATTTWERWDGRDSHNHPMMGSGLTWLTRHLAGIQADEQQPGYRHFFLNPCLPQGHAATHYAKRTPYGRVAVDIQEEGNGHLYRVTVPVGSTCTAILPTASLDAVTESGKPAAKAEGVTVLPSQGEGRVELLLNQGTYEIRF